MASHYRRWTKQEDDWLLENNYKHTIKEMSKMLNRSYASTQQRISKLTVAKMEKGKKGKEQG